MLIPSAALLLVLLGELPLPDATLYGKITTEDGLPVVSGVLKARVRRGQTVVLEAQGAFREADGAFWYVVNVPLETSIGAPGPSGAGAHEGDVVDALVLDGAPLQARANLPVLAAGAVTRVDATGGHPAFIYFRGDCSPDLELNISDPVSLLGYLFLGTATPACLEACDGDGTGGLDITDAVYLLAYLFLGGPPPPAPGPSCGVDPSPSGLGCDHGLCTS